MKRRGRSTPSARCQIIRWRRLEWERRASAIGAYRELYGYDNPNDAIGPEPTADLPEKRAHWHEAFGAMRPVDGLDVRGLPDGRLHLHAPLI